MGEALAPPGPPGTGILTCWVTPRPGSERSGDRRWHTADAWRSSGTGHWPCPPSSPCCGQWTSGRGAAAAPGGLSFEDWLQRTGPRGLTDRFLPRSLLGPDRVHIVRGLASRVTHLDGDGRSPWSPQRLRGHRSVGVRRREPPPLRADLRPRAARHRSGLGLAGRPDLVETVRANAPRTVVVRGAGLIGLDAVLALSEGIGGAFSRARVVVDTAVALLGTVTTTHCWTRRTRSSARSRRCSVAPRRRSRSAG